MPELNPLTNEQIFLKKIAENTGSNYNTGDVSEINPLTIDQILLKEIAANTAGQSGDITELEGKVADNASAIDAIVNANGCCNVFAIDNPISLSNVRVAYNGIVNTDIDSLNFFDFKFRAYVNGAYTILAQETILDDGKYSYTVSIPSNATKLQLKHNGVSCDLSIEIPTVPAGTYKLTFTVTGHNPSTVGGLEISNIMLYDARLKPTGYVPYAMTNRELTERVEKIKTGVYNGSLNDLTYTFMGFGYNVTATATGAYGFIINIAENIDGIIRINQQWCQNDQTTWHTRYSTDGGSSWSAWN